MLGFITNFPTIHTLILCFNTATYTTYCRYILVRMENPPKAESILEAALKLHPDCEIAVFNLAVIAHK